MKRIIKPLASVSITTAAWLAIFATIVAVSRFSNEAYDTVLTFYAQKNTVMVSGSPNSYGTGFLVRHQGNKYIATNAHLCDASQNGYMAVIKNGDSTPRKILAVSRKNDLCILEPIEGLGLLITTSHSKNQLLTMHGHAFNEALSARSGRIISKSVKTVPLFPVTNEEEHDRCYEIEGEIGAVFISFFCTRAHTVLETTIQGGPGASGSPVVDLLGRLVGVKSIYHTQNLRSMIVPSEFLINLINDYESNWSN
jgi:S1-C subfamily serine protease